MQILTQVLNSGDTFTITPNMTVLQFSLIGLSDSAAFSFLGKAPITNSAGTALVPAASNFTGQVSYNSKMATNPSNPWTNITISVSAGSVGLELAQN